VSTSFGVNTEEHADAAGSLHAFEVRRTVDAQEALILIGEERVPGGEELQVLHVGVGPARADRNMKNVDA